MRTIRLDVCLALALALHVSSLRIASVLLHRPLGHPSSIVASTSLDCRVVSLTKDRVYHWWELCAHFITVRSYSMHLLGHCVPSLNVCDRLQKYHLT